MSEKLLEIPLSREESWSGYLLRVRRDRVQLPDGRAALREYIEHPGAALVVPLTDAGEAVLVRQYRYPVQSVVLEFPAGKLEVGEEPLICAQRELWEETGYQAARWYPLGCFWPAVGYSTEVIHLFLAEGLMLDAPARDAEEFLEVVTCPWSVLVAQAFAGELPDGKTTYAVIRAYGFLAQRRGERL